MRTTRPAVVGHSFGDRTGLDVVDGGRDVDERWISVTGGPTGAVSVRIVQPVGAVGPLPVILYIHGAGWVFGDAHTHDRLVRDLAIGSSAAVAYPEYDRSPEAQFPTAIEQCFAVAEWIVRSGGEEQLDGKRLAVAGDSVGGNMAIALTQLAKQRGGVRFAHQVLFYPVTSAAFDTDSYAEFAEGYFLRRDGMRWFWDQYTTNVADRSSPLASRLRATAYCSPSSRRTSASAVMTRLHDTYAAKAAIAQASGALHSALHPDDATG